MPINPSQSSKQRRMALFVQQLPQKEELPGIKQCLLLMIAAHHLAHSAWRGAVGGGKVIPGCLSAA